MAQPYIAVIFDMDGLIFDTEPLYRAAWQIAARKCGYELTDEIYLRLIGLGRTGSEAVLAAEFGVGFSPERFRNECKAAEFDVLDATPAKEKPGFRELLAYLENHGVPRALATSTDRAVADRHLKHAGLMNRFAAIVAGDEVRHAKPAPDLYLLAAEKLGVDPVRCLVLEDSAPGVEAARRAGMAVFVVPDQIAPTPEVQQTAAGVFSTLFEVKTHVENLSDFEQNVVT